MSDALAIMQDLAVEPSRRRLAQGETLFATDDPVSCLFAVDSGRVDLVRHMSDGAMILLQSAGAGEILAEASLFSTSYHCDGQAVVDSDLLIYSKPAILKAARDNPEASLLLLGHFAHKLQALRARTALFGIRSAPERVLAWLRLQPQENGVVEIKRTWKQIAGELGLTHEAVYRALAKLERTGLVRRQGGHVTLSD